MSAVVSPASLVRKSPGLEAASLPPVLLVTPPSVFLLDERVFMSLGILKVAAALEKAGRRVECLDLSGIDNYLEVVELHARETAAEAVALTTTTPQLPAAVRIAEKLKTARPDLRIILGGPHVTLVAAAVKLEHKTGRVGRAHKALARLYDYFDVLVAGDGELAIFRALEETPDALVDADEPKGGLFMSSAVYEESPLPARHLADVESYRYSIDGKPATTLIAQLGCPFGCNFCGGRNSKSLRKIRTRSIASVIAEMELLHTRYGFTGFNFFDDELNVSSDLVALMDAVSALQERLKTEFRLRGFVKAELFTEDQARAMRRAGFRWLLCGFEAADPRILENINKRATVADNTRVVEICRQTDLKVKALMSVGHAGESEWSIAAVHDWLMHVRPDDFDCTIITPYPGSPYYDEALPHSSMPDVWTYVNKKSGDRLHAYDVDYTAVADYYKGDPNGGYCSYVFTDHISRERLVEMRDWVERSVREKLGIPFNAGQPARRYEHSMGQASLPEFILRKTTVGV